MSSAFLRSTDDGERFRWQDVRDGLATSIAAEGDAVELVALLERGCVQVAVFADGDPAPSKSIVVHLVYLVFFHLVLEHYRGQRFAVPTVIIDAVLSSTRLRRGRKQQHDYLARL